MNLSKIVSHLLPVLIFIGLLFALLPAASASPGSDLLPANDQERIDTYIQSRMRSSRIPGLALGVVRGDQVVYLKGYGIAGQDGRAVTPQTPFILGSSTKSFTALAVMQLVEAGKIDLNAPVTKYIPWFRTSDVLASNGSGSLPGHDGLDPRTAPVSYAVGNHPLVYPGRVSHHRSDDHPGHRLGPYPYLSDLSLAANER
jgi:CubicO group peptidase (beta-lactamase class C family)